MSVKSLVIYGTVYSTHAAIIIISASLEGLLSSTSRFIILSDLMSRLHPRKKMPKMTVSDSTQRTAICTKRMMNWSRSSWIGDPNPSLVITEKLQHPRTLSKECFAVEIVRFSSPCETFMSRFLGCLTTIDVLKLPKGTGIAKITCAFPWISYFKINKHSLWRRYVEDSLVYLWYTIECIIQASLQQS